MNSAIRLISDEIDTYLPNTDNTALIKRRNYILPSPKGKFFIVAFISHKKDGANISPVVHQAIKNDIGVVYVCDKIPSNPIINSNIHYIEVSDTWFTHTLFMNPLMFSASYASRSKKLLSRAFYGFTKFQIPIIATSSDIPKIVSNYEKNKNNILIDITGGVGDHLLAIPSLKTLAVTNTVYVLCEKHREPCFHNLSYIKGFYNQRQDVDISKFRKIIHLHFGQLLNDYRLDLNKQNRIFAVAEVCGLSKDQLVIDRPEIILTTEERNTASKKYEAYSNKVFLGYDSARVDSKLSSTLTQNIIDKLKKRSCTVFTSSVRRKKYENCIDLSRDLSLRELFALISMMDCIFTIDTSFLHIAAAFDKKIFCMLNYFKPEWRCSTYVNCKSYTPNVPCFPCVAYQFVSHEDRACHNKSCYDFQDIELILTDIKSFLMTKKKVIENIQLINNSYIPDTNKDISLMDLPGKVVSIRKSAKLRIAAFWMGGIGDAVMLGYLCRAIQRKYPDSYIDAYVRDAEHSSLFVYDYPDIKGVISKGGWRQTVEKNKDNYDISFEFNRLPYVWNNKDKSKNKYLDERIYNNWSLASNNIKKFWNTSIYEYYANETDLNLIADDMYIPIKDKNNILQNKTLKKYKLSNDFITINSGCDKNVGQLKLWDRAKWKELVTKLKTQNIDIVQLGNNFDIELENVKKIDCDNLIDLLFVLKQSKLHIGNEGGLIHLSHAVKTKSIVLFGPTEPTLYGYSDNINIYANECPTCWWTNSEWSKKCIRGHKICRNISNISVHTVYAEAIKELNNE